MADVNRQTPSPAGGTFDKDSTGALNGRVTDNANRVFGRVGQREVVSALDREIAGTAHISKMFARYGVTAYITKAEVCPRCRRYEPMAT